MEEELHPQTVGQETIQWVTKIGNGSAFIGFLVSLIFFFSMGSVSLFFVLKIIFLIPGIIYHLLAGLQFIAPRFEIEVDFTTRLFLSSDLHYFIILILIIFSTIMPILYILDYIVIYATIGIPFFISLFHLDQNPNIDRFKQIIQSPGFQLVSPIIEISLGFFLFFIAIFELKLYIWFIFVAYWIWLILFNYSTNEYHSRVWEKIGLFIRDFASKQSPNFGSWIDSAIDSFSEFVSSKNIYPNKNLKIHFQ